MLPPTSPSRCFPVCDRRILGWVTREVNACWALRHAWRSVGGDPTSNGPSIKTNWRERSPCPPCARLAQSQLRDADKALLRQYADHLDREADALERLAASIGFLLSPRADQRKDSSSRLTPRLRPTCQRKQSSFVQCGASRAKAATSLALQIGQRRGTRKPAWLVKFGPVPSLFPHTPQEKPQGRNRSASARAAGPDPA